MRSFAFGLLAALGLFTSSLDAAYIAPAGFARRAEQFTGDVFATAPDGKVAVGAANSSGGATIKVYASAAAAQANAAPLRTFSDPAYKSWGDLTFADSNTLLFTENGGPPGSDAAYRGIVSSGATSNLGIVPNAGGVIPVGGDVYTVAVNNPGTGALYKLTGGTATPVINNIGTGYLGGVARDSAGNFVLTDTNDPTFAGNAGKLLRFTSSFALLGDISLAGGNGSGAYDVILDSEGDTFVTTGSTLTRVPLGTTSAQQFGSAFTGFPFITNLDFVGSGFEPNSGNGTLWVNAVFSDDASIFGITPVPEPVALSALAILAIPMLRNSRRLALPLAAFALFCTTSSVHAEQFFATQVVDRTVGTEQQAAFTEPTLALGAPRGGGTTMNSLDVYCLGNGGSITLGFDQSADNRRGIFNGPGYDFIVFENAFYDNDDPHRSFAELMYVEVSTDNAHFARFPVYSANLGTFGPYSTIDPAKVTGFAGTKAVLANTDENSIDPFDASAAGGDAFNLCWLSNDPLVKSGVVNLDKIRYLRLVDVIGDGRGWDTVGRPIFDPTGVGIGGADVDAVAVINGTHTPEPAVALAAAGLIVARRRR